MKWRGTGRLLSLGCTVMAFAGITCMDQANHQTHEQGKSAVAMSSAYNVPEWLKNRTANRNTDAYQPGVVLVKFRPSFINSIDRNFADTTQKLGLRRIGSRTSLGVDLMQITTQESVPEVSARLSKDARIQFAEPNWRIELLETTNDPLFGQRWSLHNTGQDINGVAGKEDADIDAAEAWEISQTSMDEIIVAVADTGVAYTHEDLASVIWTNEAEKNGVEGEDDDDNGLVDDIYGWDFADDDSNPSDGDIHGTHVAGIIAAVGNNNLGTVGVAWKSNVKIMPIRIVGDQDNASFVLDAAQGIEYAVKKGAKIINCSWWTLGRESQTLEDAVTTAENNGVVVVAAAGNYALDNDSKFFNSYPAEYENPNVFSIAATDNLDLPASFTNWGPMSVDVAAPGVNIMSTINPDLAGGIGYGLLSGTSMASPTAAGAIAVMLQHKPNLILNAGGGVSDFSALRKALFLSVEPISGLEGKTVTGGRINLHRALTLLDEQNLPPVAMAGGNQLHRVGTKIVIDGSQSFDPNGDEITAYNWSLKKPDHSSAELVSEGSLTVLVPDVCGKYEISLTIEAGQEVSPPDVATVLAMNWEPLATPLETEHPYPLGVFEAFGEIQKPGATLLAPHFSQLDTEPAYDYIVFGDPNTGKYVGQITGVWGEYTGPVFALDHLELLIYSDGLINAHGAVVDAFFWCNENSNCPAGTGDCDMNPDTGDGGCETDTLTHNDHCGWCDHSCSINGMGGECNGAGVCDLSEMKCTDGYADCNKQSYDGCEVRLADDPYNCGSCANECALPYVSAHICKGGTCQVSTCVTDWANEIYYADCNGLAADGCEILLSSDPDNCGACSYRCASIDPGELDHVAKIIDECTNSVCGIVCEDGWKNCNQAIYDGCESDLTDGNNCGKCGISCAYPNAQGVCLDPESATCAMGDCKPGYADCDQDSSNGCEVSTSMDPTNCGSCGNTCLPADNATVGCLLGTCMMVCDEGYKDCDQDPANGCETDISSNASHCGSCNQACKPYTNATGACVDGACTMECLDSYADCDGFESTGCEVDISNDPIHCGGCKKKCAETANATATCSEGSCAIACAADFGDCDGALDNGCETTLIDNESNCGACGVKCPQRKNADPWCSQGVCMLKCNNGWGNCNLTESDGCETKLNNQGQCPKDDDDGCQTAGSPQSALSMLLFIIGAMVWRRRRRSQ